MSRSLDFSKLTDRFSQVKPSEIVLFYRQLALLLGSGIDIITALELLQGQTSNRSLTMVLGEVISDLRAGNRLSATLEKHPAVFSPTYCRLLNIGEETGGFEETLKHIADYMEKEIKTTKGVKNALIYPVIASVMTVIVVGVLLTFVLPAFGDLYDSLGAELPAMTKMLIDLGGLLQSYGVYLILTITIVLALSVLYIKTSDGRYKWDKIMLGIPLVGRINQLKELGRVCRSVALLFHAGLPLTDIIQITSQTSNNRVIADALIDVQNGMMKGEGLSRPMSKNSVFLSMMVHMVRVGEETGNLDTNLQAVAENYETEAEDKTRSLIGLIQPSMTVIIGLVIGVIALSLTSAMYSIYGQGV